MVSSFMVKMNFERDLSRAKSPLKSSRSLTVRALRRWPPSLFRRKILPTSSFGLTSGIDLADEGGDGLSLAQVSEQGSS